MSKRILFHHLHQSKGNRDRALIPSQCHRGWHLCSQRGWMPARRTQWVEYCHFKSPFCLISVMLWGMSQSVLSCRLSPRALPPKLTLESEHGHEEKWPLHQTTSLKPRTHVQVTLLSGNPSSEKHVLITKSNYIAGPQTSQRHVFDIHKTSAQL